MLLAPIWIVTFPPFARLSESSGSRFCSCTLERFEFFSFQQFYKSDWGAYPYLGMDASLAVLGRLFPIETAGRVYLSLCALALPATAWFFLHEAQPEAGNCMLVVAVDCLQRFLFWKDF